MTLPLTQTLTVLTSLSTFLSLVMAYFLNCHIYRSQIIFYIFLCLSSFTHLNFMTQGRVIHNPIDLAQKEVLVTRNMIGSRPPRCERKCSNCGHCKAVQVPIAPLVRRHEEGKIHHLFAAAYSRGNDISNYKPMCWKCQCGDSLYNP